MSALDVDGLRYAVDPEAHVAELLIDRPEARNAFTPAMWSAGADMLRAAGDDDAVHALLWRATGEVFCAGADVRAFDPSPDAGRPFHDFVSTLEAFPKPVVAAVQGAAVGAGFTLLAYADVTLAAPSARFRAPFVAMGLVPESGSSALLPARLGWQATADLVFTAGWLGAEEALRLDFVRAVVAPEELEATARAKAAEIGAMPLTALVASKALLRADRAGVDEARARESERFRALLAARPPAS